MRAFLCTRVRACVLMNKWGGGWGAKTEDTRAGWWWWWGVGLRGEQGGGGGGGMREGERRGRTLLRRIG